MKTGKEGRCRESGGEKEVSKTEIPMGVARKET